MESCDNHLSEYILKKDCEKRLADLLTENNSYKVQIEAYVNDNARLIQRYSRADKFLHLVLERIKHNAKVNTNYTSWNSLINLNEPSEMMIEQIDGIVQLGLDFGILLKTMKNDEILERQWKSMVMTMRLIGYDSIDKGTN